MPKPLDDGSPSLKPHGDVIRTPGENEPGASRPPNAPGTDVPPKPGQPVPYPENPDLPGTPPEPAEPDQGQPIPPELDTTKPRL